MQALVGSLGTSVVNPRWHTRIEPRRASGIGIHVGGDFQSLATGVFNQSDYLIELGPVRLPGSLQVVDFGRKTCFATDANGFFDRLGELIGFAANVRDVLTSVFSCNLCQLDQFIGLGESRGRIDESGSHAEGPAFHLPAYQLAHFVELPRSRRLIFESNHVLADGGRADERGEVLGHAALFHVGEVFGQSCPSNFVPYVPLLVHAALLHLISQRPHRTFAENLGRNPLFEFTHGTAIGNQRHLGVRKHVDKAGSDGKAGCINDGFGARTL